jgi:hypothetical protein
MVKFQIVKSGGGGEGGGFGYERGVVVDRGGCALGRVLAHLGSDGLVRMSQGALGRAASATMAMGWGPVMWMLLKA